MDPDVTDEQVQLMVYRYSIGELTDVQFNFYVQIWKLDREYVNLLLQDCEKYKAIQAQASAGCLVLLMFLGVCLILALISGILMP